MKSLKQQLGEAGFKVKAQAQDEEGKVDERADLRKNEERVIERALRKMKSKLQKDDILAVTKEMLTTLFANVQNTAKAVKELEGFLKSKGLF